MVTLNKETLIPLGTGAACVLVIVGAVATIFSWRQEDREHLANFQTSTTGQLYGIERKVDELRHRLDLFEQAVKTTRDGQLQKSDLKLWLYKARIKYPDLPDIE